MILTSTVLNIDRGVLLTSREMTAFDTEHQRGVFLITAVVLGVRTVTVDPDGFPLQAHVVYRLVDVFRTKHLPLHYLFFSQPREREFHQLFDTFDLFLLSDPLKGLFFGFSGAQLDTAIARCIVVAEAVLDDLDLAEGNLVARPDRYLL